MGFYSDFAGNYEKIFPLREGTLRFLDRWLPESGRLLDLGCGTGHYCGRLVSDERPCLGIDLDPGMITEAESSYGEPKFRILGLEEIGGLEKSSFTGIYCIGNVLPHLPARNLPAFLEAVHTLLSPGGRWIFQTVNFDPLMHVDQHDFPVLEFPEDNLKFFRRYLNTSGESLIFETRMVQDEQELFAGQTSLYPRLGSEYLALNEAAGFNLLGHFADFTGRPFVSDRLSGSIFVFEKPGKLS